MAPSLIVILREAVVVSATYGGLYLLIHCSIAQWAHSGRVFVLNKYTKYTHWTKKPEFAHCAILHFSNHTLLKYYTFPILNSYNLTLLQSFSQPYFPGHTNITCSVNNLAGS